MTKMSIAIMVTTRWWWSWISGTDWSEISEVGDEILSDLRNRSPERHRFHGMGRNTTFHDFCVLIFARYLTLHWIFMKTVPYLLEIMHFIDLPRCIKPNSTSQAALYVWLWNFSGNKNCCCPGQTPLKYCLPKLLSFKLGTFIWSNYTSFYAHQSE